MVGGSLPGTLASPTTKTGRHEFNPQKIRKSGIYDYFESMFDLL
jgi:hypothetical protein